MRAFLFVKDVALLVPRVAVSRCEVGWFLICGRAFDLQKRGSRLALRVRIV